MELVKTMQVFGGGREVTELYCRSGISGVSAKFASATSNVSDSAGNPDNSARALPLSKAITPVFARVEADDAPGGVLFAGSALAEIAAADWGAALAEPERAKLRAWAQMVAFAPAAPTIEAKAQPPDETLSPRELDVLRRIAAGDSNKLIARAFDLSPHTVKRHVANILDKLGVDTRGQAAAWFRGREMA